MSSLSCFAPIQQPIDACLFASDIFLQVQLTQFHIDKVRRGIEISMLEYVNNVHMRVSTEFSDRPRFIGYRFLPHKCAENLPCEILGQT